MGLRAGGAEVSGLTASGAGKRVNAGWRCLTCQKVFTSPATVRRHWEQYSERHSVFLEVGTSKLHHQTVEGLHERDWVLPEEPRVHQEITGVTT